MALVASRDTTSMPRVVDQLSQRDLKSLSNSQLLVALRIYELLLQQESTTVGPTVAQQLNAVYPNGDWTVDRELSRILSELDAPNFVSKTMDLLAAASRQEEQLHYLFVLRNVKRGWTTELRRRYFESFGITKEFVRGEGMGRLCASNNR